MAPDYDDHYEPDYYDYLADDHVDHCDLDYDALEVFEFAGSTNENVRKVTTDQSEPLKQQIRKPL